MDTAEDNKNNLFNFKLKFNNFLNMGGRKGLKEDMFIFGTTLLDRKLGQNTQKTQNMSRQERKKRKGMLRLSKRKDMSVLTPSFHRQYAQTTIGWAGSPSGRNMGLAQPGNPAESDLLLTQENQDTSRASCLTYGSSQLS